MLLRDAPRLARLSLGTLAYSGGDYSEEVAVFTSGAAGPLCAALRANKTLTHVTLHRLGLWRSDDAGLEVVASLAGVSSLKEIDLNYNVAKISDLPAVCAALKLIVEANLPSLIKINVTSLADGS